MWEHTQGSATGGRAYSLLAADGKLIILDDLRHAVYRGSKSGGL
jgi:hypothetical protein